MENQEEVAMLVEEVVEAPLLMRRIWWVMDIYHAMAGKGLDRAVAALVVELKSKLNIGKSSVLDELILITENLFRFFFFVL